MRFVSLAQLVAPVRLWVSRFFPILDRHRAARQFVKFCLVGASNVTIDLGVYLALTRFWHWYFLYASIASFLFAVSWSFHWNRRWTFRVSGRTAARQFPKFVIVNITSGAGQTALLYGLVEGFGWYDLYAKALAILLATFWNFTVTKFWAFRR